MMLELQLLTEGHWQACNVTLNIIMKAIKGKKSLMYLKFLVANIQANCEVCSWSGEEIVTKYNNIASLCIYKDISIDNCTI